MSTLEHAHIEKRTRNDGGWRASGTPELCNRFRNFWLRSRGVYFCAITKSGSSVKNWHHQLQLSTVADIFQSCEWRPFCPAVAVAVAVVVAVYLRCCCFTPLYCNMIIMRAPECWRRHVFAACQVQLLVARCRAWCRFGYAKVLRTFAN